MRRRQPAVDRARDTQRRFFIVVALAGVGFGMTAPLTFLYAKELGASDLVAGLAVSSVAVSLLLVDVFGTKLVPRVDGRLAMWFSLTVFGVGSMATAASPALVGMIGARIFQGIGAAFFLGGGLNVVLRLAPPERSGQAIGAFNAAWFVGVALGPLLGGLLAAQWAGPTGYRVAFAVCGLVCFGVAVAARIVLPSIPGRKRPRLSIPRRAHARPGMRLWPPLLLSGIGQGVRGGLVMTLIPWLGERDLGLSLTTVGAAIGALSVVDVLTMRAGGRLADRLGRRTVLGAALVSGAVVCTLTPLVDGPVSFMCWCAASGVVVAVTWVVPAAVVVDVAAEPEAGLASYRVSADVGQLLGATTVGALIGAVGATDSAVLMGLGFALLAGWVGRMRETGRAILAERPESRLAA